jgi:formate hydrogenlyase subunit 3/multisubunit Na+/H+ antiporter MnhD subunit
MHFSGPVLLLIGPLLAGVLAMLVRRWQRVTAVVGLLLASVLWFMVRAIPLAPTAIEAETRLFAGGTLVILGRVFVLTEQIQFLLLLLLVSLILLFLISLWLPQGRDFVPINLVVLSPLMAALMVRSFSFGALFLLMAMALLTTLIQAHPGSVRAALRYLIMGVLAACCVLLAAWMLDNGQTDLSAPASRLLLVGFVILLAGFPFYVWAIPVVTKTPSLVSVVVLGLVQLTVTMFIFAMVQANSWLYADAEFVRLLRWSGLMTVLLAGLAALTADWRRLLGALVLLDMGMALLSLLLGPELGWQTAVTIHLSRTISLLLAGVGLTGLRQIHQDFAGLERRAPVSALLFVFGCVSLLGLPLTMGFNGRWLIITHMPDAWSVLLLWLGMAGGVLGVWQAVIRLFSQPTEAVFGVEPGLTKLVLGVSLLAFFILALVPQSFLSLAEKLALLP